MRLELTKFAVQLYRVIQKGSNFHAKLENFNKQLKCWKISNITRANGALIVYKVYKQLRQVNLTDLYATTNRCAQSTNKRLLKK